MRTIADHALAKRLERFAADDISAFVAVAAKACPGDDPQCIEVAGGVAGFIGPGSPVNGAIGMGLSGEVTHGEIAEVERFFSERAETPIVGVCPLAHPSMARVLGERGWSIGTFENVMVREIVPGEHLDPPTPGIEIRTADSHEDRDVWALMVARGFAAPDDPSPAELNLATIASRKPGANFLFGMADGDYAGTGQLETAGEIAWLSADTTLVRFRRRGVQASLQRARLEMARRADCTLAVSECVPGSPSQRNMERLGFRVAYTRVDAIRQTTPSCL